MRRFLAVLLSLSLFFTTVACNSQSSTADQRNSTPKVSQVKTGRYPVQQATYNDADGEYTLMLLNTPAGTPPTFRTTNLQMARLTEEQISKGDKTSVEVNGDQATMYLTEDFKIEYVHNVTETRDNPQTGERETVVVRQQSGFWAPFAGAVAGQALGSLLFSPRYYVPPMYQPGGVITGYGGYGNSYDQAVRSYQTKYNAPPPAVKNRQTLRTTGNIRKSPSTGGLTRRTQSPGNKSTGSGYGSSRLKTSGGSSTTRSKSGSSFGSGSRSRSRSGSFGRRR
jgi:hypothetical protein